MASGRIGKKFEENLYLVNALEDLFKKDDSEETGTLELVTNKEVDLPKLVAPFKDKSRGWMDSVVADQAKLYLNCLGYGHGGKSLVDTKIKKAEKPEWWPSKLTFGQYDHPSKESLQKNEFLIEGILTYFNYDVLSHCDSPPAIQKNQRRRRRTKITSKTCQRSPLRTDTSWKVG